MKASLLEAYGAGGLTGVVMRERIKLKLADKFHKVAENKKLVMAALMMQLATGVSLAMLVLLIFANWFASLRSVVFVNPLPASLWPFALLSVGIFIGFFYLTIIAGYLAVSYTSQVVYGIAANELANRDEQVEL